MASARHVRTPGRRGDGGAGGPAAGRARRGHAGGGLPSGKLFVLVLVAVGGYGGYFGYCKYAAGTKLHAFGQRAQGLRQAVLALGKPVAKTDLRRIVQGFAEESGVTVDPAAIEVSIEALDQASIAKLPTTIATAMRMADKMPRHRRPRWVVGFRVTVQARHGVARRSDDVQRYTYVDSAAP